MIDLDQLAQFWTTYGTAVILTIGGVTAALGAVLGWRWFRHGEAHKRTGTLAVVLATAFSAEGMWEVARESLHLQIHIALVLFAMFEIVMVNQGLLAKHKLDPKVPGSPRKHMVFVWLIAFATGGIASTNADNLTEFTLRLVAPSVAAGIWWTTLTADGVAKDQGAVTIRWSLRRLALWVGAIEPGENDVQDVDRERRLSKLIDLANARQRGTLTDRKARRLSRLERHADDAMLDEVIRRMDRSAWFSHALDTPAPLAPGTPAPVPSPPAEPLAAPVPAPHVSTPSNGSGTPTTAPLNGSGTGAAAPPPSGAGTFVQRFSTPIYGGTGTPAAPRANGTPAPSVTSGGTPDSTPEDAVLLAVLRDPSKVLREPDGTVPIKRAIKVLGVGRPRAMRLLSTLQLLRVPDPDDGSGTPDSTPPAEGSGTGADDEDRHPELLNGHRPLALTGA